MKTSAAGRACGAAVALACSLAVASLPVVAVAHSDGEWEHGPHMMWGGGWPGMLFGFVMMVAVIAAVVALVVFLVRALGGQARAAPGQAGPSRTSLDILEERFARGEIDASEFEERRRVLRERSA